MNKEMDKREKLMLFWGLLRAEARNRGECDAARLMRPFFIYRPPSPTFVSLICANA
jgi:hypothetical protein